MLSLEKVLEVKRLLDEGRLSRRAIAASTGVSRGSVNAIANGQRGLHGKRPEDEPPSHTLALEADARRCPDCGGLVFLPCVLCEARRHAASESATRAA